MEEEKTESIRFLRIVYNGSMEKSRLNSKKADLNNLTDKGLCSSQHIIDVAMAMIRTNGYSETTLQDICNEAGIGIGTFYYYFNSKKEILLAYIDEENQELLDFYARQDKTSYGDAILAVADRYVDMYLFKGAKLISNAYSLLLFPGDDTSIINKNVFYQILQDAFVGGQRQGEFSKETAESTFCSMFVGEWFFITTLWCNIPQKIDLRERVAEQFTNLLRLVKEPPTGEH